MLATIRELFRTNWNGEAVRLLGVHAAHFDDESEQLSLLNGAVHQKWNQALSAADRLRERFGEERGIAGQRYEGTLPRAHARESGGPAGEKAGEVILAESKQAPRTDDSIDLVSEHRSRSLVTDGRDKPG